MNRGGPSAGLPVGVVSLLLFVLLLGAVPRERREEILDDEFRWFVPVGAAVLLIAWLSQRRE